MTYRALFLVSLIIATGAAVRLSGSGLGCPTWPKCSGQVYPPLQSHAMIEYGNRVVSASIGIGVTVQAVMAFGASRSAAIWRSSRCCSARVRGQAVLGGYTVENKLAPGFVMSHFYLSIVHPDPGGRARLAGDLRARLAPALDRSPGRLVGARARSAGGAAAVRRHGGDRGRARIRAVPSGSTSSACTSRAPTRSRFIVHGTG